MPSALESGGTQLEAHGDRGAVCWDQHSVYCQEPCRASEQSNLINFLRELQPNPIEIGLEQEPAGCPGLWAAAPGSGRPGTLRGKAHPHLGVSGKLRGRCKDLCESPLLTLVTGRTQGSPRACARMTSAQLSTDSEGRLASPCCRRPPFICREAGGGTEECRVQF